jgi:hypothetical protein
VMFGMDITDPQALTMLMCLTTNGESFRVQPEDVQLCETFPDETFTSDRLLDMINSLPLSQADEHFAQTGSSDYEYTESSPVSASTMAYLPPAEGKSTRTRAADGSFNINSSGVPVRATCAPTTLSGEGAQSAEGKSTRTRADGSFNINSSGVPVRATCAPTTLSGEGAQSAEEKSSADGSDYSDTSGVSVKATSETTSAPATPTFGDLASALVDLANIEQPKKRVSRGRTTHTHQSIAKRTRSVGDSSTSTKRSKLSSCAKDVHHDALKEKCKAEKSEKAELQRTAKKKNEDIKKLMAEKVKSETKYGKLYEKLKNAGKVNKQEAAELEAQRELAIKESEKIRVALAKAVKLKVDALQKTISADTAVRQQQLSEVKKLHETQRAKEQKAMEERYGTQRACDRKAIEERHGTQREQDRKTLEETFKLKLAEQKLKLAEQKRNVQNSAEEPAQKNETLEFLRVLADEIQSKNSFEVLLRANNERIAESQQRQAQLAETNSAQRDKELSCKFVHMEESQAKRDANRLSDAHKEQFQGETLYGVW